MISLPVTNHRNCPHCGKIFCPLPAELNRGKGRFCSYTCGNRCRSRPLIDRFFEGVGKKTPEGCILWGRSLKAGWHGQIGKGKRGRGMLVASRVSFEIFIGPIPEGMSVLHRCDNPACINPVHLFLGTQKDNMQDMWSKGRGSLGEKHYLAKITADDVRAIRRRADEGEEQKSLAKEFNISKANVCLIVSRSRWKHVV